MDNKSFASRIKELLQFLTITKGDLTNTTGPPSMLAPMSVVEVGRCWAQRPAVFAAPALEPDPVRRCLLVLRMFLIALRSQVYIGGSPTTSIRKPLNAFLGEVFLAEWEQPVPPAPAATTATAATPAASRPAKTRLVAEQVSHHPPITAMHMVDEANGVRADGYARVEMTFDGAVNVRQVGHAVMHLDTHDEDYLFPLPDIKVRGFLSARLYPEITSVYHIVGSSGCSAEIKFSGQGFAWGGKRNAFVARVFDAHKAVVYTAEGIWSQAWTVKDNRSGQVLEKYVVDAPENQPVPVSLPPSHEQDPWETRRAWAAVHEGLETGNTRQVVAEKSKIEQAQRRMRAREAADGVQWTPLLFAGDGAASKAAAETIRRLSAAVPATGGPAPQLNDHRTKGVWRVLDDKIKDIQRPLRGGTTPLGDL